MAEVEASEGLEELNDYEQAEWARAHEGWGWINAHSEILEKHRGQFIAIWAQQVVANADDPESFRAAIEASPFRKEALLTIRVPRRDELEEIIVL